MARMNQELVMIANEAGLSCDEQSGVVFGNKNGYEVTVTRLENNITNVSVSVSRTGEMPDNNEIKMFVKQHKNLANYSMAGHKITFTIRANMGKGKRVSDTVEAIAVITDFLKANGYENCCQECGTISTTDSYIISGTPKLSCSSCFAKAANQVDAKNESAKMKKENVVAGVVGALIGSLIGAAAIIIIAKLGYVAWISGVIMGVCTLKGYEILGKKLSKKGVVISFVIMIAMVFMAYQTFQAMDLVEAFKSELYTDVNFFDMFKNVMPLLKELDASYPSEGIMSSYYLELAKFYAFTLIGAIPTAIAIMKEKKLGNVTYKMSRNEVM